MITNVVELNLNTEAHERSPLAVSEIFGPTFQGEGKNVGMPCMFLRLAGCNLRCVWCDSKYTWDWQHYDKSKEVRMMSTTDIFEKLAGSPVKHLVVSGGEPMLQWRNLEVVTRTLRTDGWFVEIETAGTVRPGSAEVADQFNVSPKLGNSGNGIYQRYHPDVLAWFSRSNRAIFKFVVQSLDDFEEIDRLVAAHYMQHVYIMPQTITVEGLNVGLEIFADATLKCGYNLTPRLHLQIWGNRRGV